MIFLLKFEQKWIKPYTSELGIKKYQKESFAAIFN
jgi:hypothetical protein